MDHAIFKSLSFSNDKCLALVQISLNQPGNGAQHLCHQRQQEDVKESYFE